MIERDVMTRKEKGGEMFNSTYEKKERRGRGGHKGGGGKISDRERGERREERGERREVTTIGQ
jgi:hypothetical protein